MSEMEGGVIAFMPVEQSPEPGIKEWLKSLGVSSICEWDILFFLNRHGVTITRNGDLSRLVGYESQAVSDALDKLKALELITVSHSDARSKFYQVWVSSHTQYKTAFQQLTRVAATREGRLMLAKQFKIAASSPTGREATSNSE